MEPVLLALTLLFIVLIAFGVYNIRKNRKIAAAQYEQVLSQLTDRMEREAEKLQLSVDDTYFTVTDEKQGVLLGFDSDQRMVLLCEDDRIVPFSYDALRGCDLLFELDGDPAFCARIGITLHLEPMQDLQVLIAHQRRKASSYVTTMLRDNTEGMRRYLLAATGRNRTGN